MEYIRAIYNCNYMIILLLEFSTTFGIAMSSDPLSQLGEDDVIHLCYKVKGHAMPD